MKKKDNFFVHAHYAAPVCNVVEMKARRVMCGSDFGETGHAGSNITNDDITNYGEDF